MAPIKQLGLVLVLVCTLAGCSRSTGMDGSRTSASAEATPEAKGPSPALAGVNESLKAGSYDDAAARLLELQASGRSFSPREAAEHRKAMNEAYSRALEAAERGDTRAEAAIKMIRAANTR